MWEWLYVKWKWSSLSEMHVESESEQFKQVKVWKAKTFSEATSWLFCLTGLSGVWGQGQGGQSLRLQRRKSRVANSIRMIVRNTPTITTWSKKKFAVKTNELDCLPRLGRLLEAQGEYWAHQIRASWSQCSRNNQNHRSSLLWNIIILIWPKISWIWVTNFHLMSSVLRMWNPAWFLKISYFAAPGKKVAFNSSTTIQSSMTICRKFQIDMTVWAIGPSRMCRTNFRNDYPLSHDLGWCWACLVATNKTSLQ